MLASRPSRIRGRDPGRSRVRTALATLLLSGAALALSSPQAFGEGSVNLNTGPAGAPAPGNYRHGLSVANASGAGLERSALSVYVQPGETIQTASSLVGVGGNIRIFAPGADPATALPLVDCVVAQPGTGRIATRAEELAGPLPNAGGYDTCDFTVPAGGPGIYTVIMYGTSSVNGDAGYVEAPNAAATQGYNASMWDVTVRDSGGAALPGRLFAPRLQLRTAGDLDTASGAQAFVYTRTGYEYQVNFYEHAGVNWIFTSDDRGIVDAATGDRIFASFACGNDQPTNNTCQFTNATPATDFGGGIALSLADQYPLFLNRVDPVVISGPGGLGATYGYADTPISPASNPLSGATFTGADGPADVTDLGSGGAFAFSFPTQLAGLDSTLDIDLDRDGTFGSGGDYSVTEQLSDAGSQSVPWDGLDAQDDLPACGDFQYQIRSTLAEVHFSQVDVENSGGTRIERLTLPADPSLGDPLAASYDNRDPYKGGYVVTNNPQPVVTDGISGPGFNAWSDNTGNTDYIDTWARLPEVATSGTLRVLCSDPQVVKTAEPATATPGETLTFKLAVTNNGPDTAENVVVTDTLPSSVEFRSASRGCSEAGGVVTCTLPSLAAGASQTFDVVVAVPSDANQCIDNTAIVSSDGPPDVDPDNNTSALCVDIVKQVDLEIAKDPSSASVSSGGQVTYTIVARNHGPSDATGVEVDDPLAPGLRAVSAQTSQGTCATANNRVRCDLGTLASGGSAQVLVTADVTAPAGSCGASAVVNTVTIGSDDEDTDPSNNQDSASVCTDPPPTFPRQEPVFDLATEKTVDVSRPVVGQPLTYTVVVRNNGPDAAPAATLTDVYNKAATVVSVRTPQGSCTQRLPISCELGRIEPGASVTVTVVIKPLEDGAARNTASVTSCCGTDPTPGNNVDSADIRARKVPLRLTKVASKRALDGGDAFSYTLRVRNPSKGEARNVRVCDRLPSGITFVSATPKPQRRGQQQCWTVKRLGAGASKTFRIKVRAAVGANGRKVNTATATSPDGRRAQARAVVRVSGRPTPVTG